MKGYLNKVSGNLFLFAKKFSIASLISYKYIMAFKMENKFHNKKVCGEFYENSFD